MRLFGSLLAVALFVVAAWFVAGLLGFRFDLGFSLVASVVLTLVLRLILGAFRRGR